MEQPLRLSGYVDAMDVLSDAAADITINARSRRPDLAFQEGDKRITAYEHELVMLELN